jgi:hypothetical protein
MSSQDSLLIADQSSAQLHFVGGEKGGVGKSLMARILAQYFIDKSLPFIGIDTDRSHGTFLRFYSDYASPIAIDRYETLDGIVEGVMQTRQRVLVDLAAQSYAMLTRWMDDSGVLDVANELDVTLTYWHVMDAGKDSVDLLQTLLDRFGDRLRVVVVLNEIRGSEFEILKASGQLERARSLGALTVQLRKLSDATLQKIDQFNTSFWAASQPSADSPTGLALFERQRVKVWLNSVYGQLDALKI